MFNNPDRGDIKLAVFLEPSITPVDRVITPESLTNQTNYLCDNYFNRPGYMRIDNKPVDFHLCHPSHDRCQSGNVHKHHPHGRNE